MSDQYLRVNYTFPLHQGCTPTDISLASWCASWLVMSMARSRWDRQRTSVVTLPRSSTSCAWEIDMNDNGEKLVMNVGACLRCFLLEAPSNGGAPFVQPQGFEYMVFGIACS